MGTRKNGVARAQIEQFSLFNVGSPEFMDITENVVSKRVFRAIDLFAGAGGISLGLEQAGFHVDLAIEFEENAIKTLKRNFSKTPVIGEDIRNVSSSRIKSFLGNNDIDLLVGGFPCQGFSLSGRRDPNDDRNFLYRELHRIVKDIRPKYVVCENVVGILSMQGGKVVEQIVKDFEEIGYPNMAHKILIAADYGTPQLRKRVIFIANRLGLPNLFPAPKIKPNEYITTRQAISDLERAPENAAWNHVFSKHSKEMQERLLAVPEGGQLYDHYSDAWKKCPANQPSCTIKENHGGVNIHYKLPRVLTVREMARLQGFPDVFIFEGSRKWQMVQVGNAVPPQLAHAVGKCVMKLILDSEEATENR